MTKGGGIASALLLAAAGCGGRPPAVFVGESAHFLLHVDPALMPLPAAFAGDNALAALETEWSDVATMLKMPDGGKIAYYWYTPEHIGAACEDAAEGGCTKEDDMEIDAPLLPDAHELNHAYTYLRAPRRPIPFLAEGMAEAIGCGVEPPIAAAPDGDWRAAVAGVRTDAVYGQGGRFVRQMIRRHGIDEFLRYYEQSPERRDPALFAANFQSFWGASIDDVWAEINTNLSDFPLVDQKICPCSLPSIAATDSPANDPARAPYWTLPDVGEDDSIALTAPRYSMVSMRKCAGDEQSLAGKAVLTRIGARATEWYVTAPLAAAAIDRFVADTCSDAAHYTLSPDVLVGNPYMSIVMPATTRSAVFLAIDVPFPLDMHVEGANAFCDSCNDFDEGFCEPIPGEFTLAVTGGFYARMQFYASAVQLSTGVLDSQALRFFR